MFLYTVIFFKSLLPFWTFDSDCKSPEMLLVLNN